MVSSLIVCWFETVIVWITPGKIGRLMIGKERMEEVGRGAESPNATVGVDDEEEEDEEEELSEAAVSKRGSVVLLFVGDDFSVDFGSSFSFPPLFPFQKKVL